MNSDEWTIELQTLSKEGAIKVCTILANAIDNERLTKETTRIFLYGGRDKNFVMNTMAKHLSDTHSAYTNKHPNFVEGRAGHSSNHRINRHIVRGITHKGQGMAISFRHLSGLHQKSWFETLRSKFDKSRLVGLDFQTELSSGYGYLFTPHISIDFKHNKRNEIQAGEGRSWRIRINSKALQTPEMRAALDQLQKYDDRREKRLINKPPVTLRLP